MKIKVSRWDLLMDSLLIDQHGLDYVKDKINQYIDNNKLDIDRAQKKYDRWFLKSSNFKRAQKWLKLLNNYKQKEKSLKYRLQLILDYKNKND